jgi:hypothetical protein
MNGWLAIGLVIAGLAAVALLILVFDIARGDVGGGRHTMARARRLLVVAIDEETTAGAEQWVEEQLRERPELQCFVLAEPEGQDLYVAVQDAIEREHPDAVVMARHEGDSHWALEGTYGRLKEEHSIPVDAIYISKAGES